MTSPRQSPPRSLGLTDMWNFLDKEDPDYESLSQVRGRIVGNGEPLSKASLKPATFGAFASPIGSSANVLRSSDSIHLPTFSNKYGGNAYESGSRPSSQIGVTTSNDNADDSVSAIYGVVGKKRNQTPTAAAAASRPFSSMSSPVEDYPRQDSLFKRYEAGSILSTISSVHPPVVYHDSEALVRASPSGEDYDGRRFSDGGYDDVDAAAAGYSKSIMYRHHPAKKDAAATGCPRRTLVVVFLAVLLTGGIVSIAVGIALSQRQHVSTGYQSNATAPSNGTTSTAATATSRSSTGFLSINTTFDSRGGVTVTDGRPSTGAAASVVSHRVTSAAASTKSANNVSATTRGSSSSAVASYSSDRDHTATAASTNSTLAAASSFRTQDDKTAPVSGTSLRSTANAESTNRDTTAAKLSHTSSTLRSSSSTPSGEDAGTASHSQIISSPATWQTSATASRSADLSTRLSTAASNSAASSFPGASATFATNSTVATSSPTSVSSSSATPTVSAAVASASVSTSTTAIQNSDSVSSYTARPSTAHTGATYDGYSSVNTTSVSTIQNSVTSQ